MEHTKAYQEFKKNGNTKFVRYSEGAEMYHMSVSKDKCETCVILAKVVNYIKVGEIWQKVKKQKYIKR